MYCDVEACEITGGVEPEERKGLMSVDTRINSALSMQLEQQGRSSNSVESEISYQR